MDKKILKFYCFLLGFIYYATVNFQIYYKKITNTCINGCDNCYNYPCKRNWFLRKKV